MKREELEKLGVTEKETIDAILDINSTDIGKAKGDAEAKDTQISDLQKQLSERDDDIEELSKQTGNNAELQTQLQDLKDKYQTDTEAFETRMTEYKRDSAIELALTQAGARNLKAAKALINLDEIKVTDDGIEGLDNQIKAISESDDYLFGTGETTGNITPGGNPSGSESLSKKGAGSVGKDGINVTETLTKNI